MASSLADSSSSADSAGTPQPLLDACAAWNTRTVVKLLRAGADPNAAGSGGITPLLACFPRALVQSPGDLVVEARRRGDNCIPEAPCSLDQVTTMEMLLQYGADPWQASEAGVFPVGAAAASSTYLLQLLVATERLSSSSSPQTAQHRPSPAGDVASCSPKLQSSTTGNDNNTSSTRVSDEQSSRPAGGSQLRVVVCYVCRRGCLKGLRFLLQRGLVLDLQAALHTAVSGLHVDLASSIVAAGAACFEPLGCTKYLHQAVMGASTMQLADRSIVSGRLANMLRLLIQHGGIQGGFEAAAEAAAHGFNAALVVLHGAGVDMQSDTQSLVAEKGKGKGLLELALEHGNLHTLPLLVSMGVCWQERAVGQPPLNARSVKGCKPRELYNCWLQTGVGLHYAQQHGLTAMAAAYQQLLEVLTPPPHLVEHFVTEYISRHWPEEAGSSWHVAMRAPVLRRTLEVLQDPQQLGQLVERLEASDWLYQSRQAQQSEEDIYRWPELMTPEQARMCWVVDAASFTAAGGLVVTPAAPVDLQAAAPLAAAAAAGASGSQATAITDQDGTSNLGAEIPTTATPAPGQQEADAAAAAGNNVAAAARNSRLALAFPVQVLCVMDLLAFALLQVRSDQVWRMFEVVYLGDWQLLEIMLQLGVPASFQMRQDAVESTPLMVALASWQPGSSTRKRTLQTVQVLMQHGAQVNEPYINKQTCIAWAIKAKAQELQRALLSCPDKMTPAAQKDLSNEVSKLYLTLPGADKWLTLLSAKGLDVLPHMGDVVNFIPRSVWKEDKKVQAVEALVALGWDINSPGREGPIKTMLFAATKHGQWILVQWLLEHGGDCGEDWPLDCLLPEAADSGVLDGIRMLMAAGAVLEPHNVPPLVSAVSRNSKGRYTAAMVEKWLRGQIKLQQQQLSKEASGSLSSSSGKVGTATTDTARAAEAEAAAAQLLADEEATAAAAASKAAKKAKKKQRQAAAKAAAEAASVSTRQEAEQAAAAAAATAAAAAPQLAMASGASPSGAPEQPTGSLPSNGLAMTFTRPPGEQVDRAAATATAAIETAAIAAAAAFTESARAVPQDSPQDTTGGRQSASGSSRGLQSQQQQQQQQEHTSAVDRADAAPAVLHGPPPVAHVSAPEAGSSSSSSSGAVPAPVVFGASLGSPGPPATPTPLPGVAGLFLQLSERRNAGGAPVNTPAAAGSTVPSHGSAGLAPLAAGLAGGPVPASSSNGSSSSAQDPAVQGEGGTARLRMFGSREVGASASGSSRPTSSDACVPQLQQDSPDGTTAPLKRPIKVDKNCIVCMAARCSVLQLPCGHLICCEACTQLLRGKGRECPLCRTEVAEYWAL